MAAQQKADYRCRRLEGAEHDGDPPSEACVDAGESNCDRCAEVGESERSRGQDEPKHRSIIAHGRTMGTLMSSVLIASLYGEV